MASGGRLKSQNIPLRPLESQISSVNHMIYSMERNHNCINFLKPKTHTKIGGMMLMGWIKPFINLLERHEVEYEKKGHYSLFARIVCCYKTFII